MEPEIAPHGRSSAIRITSGSNSLRAAVTPFARVGQFSGTMQRSRRFTPALGLPAEHLRPCSLLIRVLYGQTMQSALKERIKTKLDGGRFSNVWLR